MIDKSKLEDEIHKYNKDAKKLNKDINKFYDKMSDHHKYVSNYDKQNRLIKASKKQKKEIENMREKQDKELQHIIDQYEKDKAESDAKNQEVINYKGCTVIIRKGDLTEEREDAIVNPANEQLDHVGGAS